MRVRKAEREEYRRMVLGIGEYAPPKTEVKVIEEKQPEKKASFAEQLFDLYKKSGKKVDELAKDLDVSVNTFKDWMNKGAIPRRETFEEIEKYFGYSFNPAPVCVHWKLNSFMKENGFTFKDMCDLTGYSLGDLRSMAGPRRLIPYEKGMELATKLGLDPDYFSREDTPVEKIVEEPEVTKEEMKAVMEKERKMYPDNDNDKKNLENLELAIRAIPSTNLTMEEKKRVFATLAEFRSKLESKVLFGE